MRTYIHTASKLQQLIMPITKRYILILLFSFVGSIALSQTARAEIYKWTDAEGNIQFSDTAPSNQAVKKIKLEINSISIPKISSNPNSTTTSRRVVIYTTDWCGYCKKAKKFMRKNNIAFSEYDIEKSARAKREYDRLNGHGVPLIVVGEKTLSGFSPSSLMALLK